MTNFSKRRTISQKSGNGGVYGVKGADIPSASSMNLYNSGGDYNHVTGTTTITSLGTATAGFKKTLVFDGVLTITYNATSLILPSSANITTTAGDVATFISEGGGNWKCTNYLRNDISYKAATLATTVYKLGSIITQTATSSTTISDLTIPLEANSEYLIEGYLVMDCSSTGGQKVGVTVPTGATFNAWILGRSTSSTAFQEIGLNTSGTVTAAMQTFANGGVQVKFNAWVTTTGTAGNFSIQLQAGVAGQSTKMYPGSMLKLSKI